MSDERTDRLKAEMARQKAERKEKGEKYGNKDLLEVLGYSDLPRISEVLNGKIHLNDNQYQRLADHWGVRVEYLKCIDDFRTLDDMYAAAEAKRTEYIDFHLRYLELLGYDVRTQLMMSCSHYTVFEELWPQIKPTLTDEALNAPFRCGKDGQYLSLADWENGKIHLNNHACIDLHVKTTLAGSPTNNYKSDPSHFHDGISYRLEFVVSQNGSPIATLQLGDMTQMFKQIDAHAKAEVDIATEQHPYIDHLKWTKEFIDRYDYFSPHFKEYRRQQGQQD